MIEGRLGPAVVPVATGAVGRERVTVVAVVVGLVARETIVCIAGYEQRLVTGDGVATGTRSASVCTDESKAVGYSEVVEGGTLPRVLRVATEAICREAVTMRAIVVAFMTADTVVLIRCGEAKLVPGNHVAARALSDRVRP